MADAVRSVQQPHHRHPGHHHGGKRGHRVAGTHIRQQRTVRVEDVVHRDDRGVEQVAAEDVAHRHVQSADAHGGEGHHHLRQRRHEADEQGAHEALVPAHARGQGRADEGQPRAGDDHHHRRRRVAQRNGAQAHVRELVGLTLGELLDASCLVLEHRVHRDHVQQDQEHAVDADGPDRHRVPLAGEHDAPADHPQQDDAESRAQDVASAGVTIQGFTPTRDVQDHEDEQIEGAASEHVAGRDVGHAGGGDRADAGRELR